MTFPSPLGVIFSLILTLIKTKKKLMIMSFRLLSELYSLLFYTINLEEDGTYKVCFRLLSELYSLLFRKGTKWKNLKLQFPSPLGVIFSLMYSHPEVVSASYLCDYSFRLLSELYSLLCYTKSSNSWSKNRFPSPLGVIFSLILYSKNFLFVIVYRAIIVWFFKF